MKHLQSYEEFCVNEGRMKDAFKKLGDSARNFSIKGLYNKTLDFGRDVWKVAKREGKETAQAVSILKKYIEIAPDEPNPYDSLGEIYLLMGEYELAEQYFQQALKINEGFYASIDHLANVYIDKGDFKRALKIHTEYAEKVPEGNLKADAYSRLAATYWKLGKHNMAIENFQKALE